MQHLSNCVTDAVVKDMAHTSQASVLSGKPGAPWQIDCQIPIIPLTYHDQGCSLKTTDRLARLQSLYRTDSICSGCKHPLLECPCGECFVLESDTTFQPKQLLLQQLANAGRATGEQLHCFGRGGSPLCGLTVQDIAEEEIPTDDIGCFIAMFFLSWLCTPLFTCLPYPGEKISDTSALFRSLGSAAYPNSEIDTFRQLIRKHVNQQSPLLSGGPTSPGNILRTWIRDVPKDYVYDKMGVVETTETELGQSIAHCDIIDIRGPGNHTLENIIKGSPVNGKTWQVKRNFFWAELGVDSSDSSVDCEPELWTDTGKWYMLGFICRAPAGTNNRWVATIRNYDTNHFFVMDHCTSEPKRYDMTHIGVQNPALVLYGRDKPRNPAWLRTRAPSRPPGASSNLLDRTALATDGLVTGSVNDLLLTSCQSASLQTDLLKGISELLRKVNGGPQHSRQCPRSPKTQCVEGWPMPHPNKACLVYRSNDSSHQRGGSVISTKYFGEVHLQAEARTHTVSSILLSVCPVCDVFKIDFVIFRWMVLLWYILMISLYILIVGFVISNIRTSNIWNLIVIESKILVALIETPSTRTLDNN